MLEISAIIERLWPRYVSVAALFAAGGALAFGLIVTASDSAFANSGERDVAAVEVDQSNNSELRGWDVAVPLQILDLGRSSSSNIWVSVCLKNVGGKWRVGEFCDYLKDTGAERIYFLAPQKKIYLGVEADTEASNGEPGFCTASLLQNRRVRSGKYTLCDSNFAEANLSRNLNPLLIYVGALAAVSGKRAHHVQYAPNLLKDAVIESGAVAVVDAEIRDRIRREHGLAEGDESSLRRFASRYAKFAEWDEDGLSALAIEQADEVAERDRKFQQRTESILYRAHFLGIKDSDDPQVWGEFVKKYEGKDPEGLVPRAIAKIEAIHLARYRDEYEKIKDSAKLADLRRFIARHEEKDPDGLVRIIAAKIEDIMLARYRDDYARLRDSADIPALRSFADKHRRDDPDGVVPSVEARIAVVVRDFRANLAGGETSHCGLVIEVKDAVVKLQTIVGEHWLKTSQIYPENAAPCRFFNNVYQAPRLDY